MYLGRRPQRRPLRLIILLLLLILLATISVYYISQEQFQIAEPFQVTPTPTRSALSYLAEAEAYYQEGQLDEAIAAFERAIALNPNDVTPRVRLSQILILRERTAEALQQAQAAVSLQPSDPQALAVLCRSYDWEGLYAQAFDACECAVELAPDYAEGYAYLAEAYADTGAWGPARNTAAQAVELDYQSVDAHRNQGYVYEMQGRFQQAAEAYENAIFLQPNLAPLYASAGRVYRVMGKFDDAVDRFQKVIRLDPNNPMGYDQLGWTYYVAGDYARAVDNLEMAIELNPEYAVSWGHLGIVNYVMQQYEEAIVAFQKAIDLYEMSYLSDNARQVVILDQDTTFDPPRPKIVMSGVLLPLNRQGVDTLTASLKPVLVTKRRLPGAEQTCGDLIAYQLQSEALPGATTSEEQLAETATATGTPEPANPLENAQGKATVGLDAGKLTIHVEHVPQPAGVPYEVQTIVWPEEAISMGYFQPDIEGNASVEYTFGDFHPAPVEYYYSLGFSYIHLDNCEKGIPWLRLSLNIDPSPTNPAWQGLSECPQN